MKLFIRSMSSISPQRTFGDEGLFSGDVVPYKTNRLACIEPDYNQYVDPKMIRRMSRVIKMGVAAGLHCLRAAQLAAPDAIVTATAYGCLEDTGVFLKTMVEAEGEPMAPTAFVHSTHNTIGAQIALLLKCHKYNNTFVSGGSSFENALLDAMLLLAEKETGNVLVGGIDEITNDSFSILQRLGKYKEKAIDSADLFADKTKGTIAGEGAAFFLLSDTASGKDIAQIDGLYTFYKPVDEKDIDSHIRQFVSTLSYGIYDIDLLITGRNGDLEHDLTDEQLTGGVFAGVPAINYKHLSGEYPTSVSFALWLGAKILSTQTLPGAAANIPEKPVRHLLIYNHYQQKHHSLIALSIAQ